MLILICSKCGSKWTSRYNPSDCGVCGRYTYCYSTDEEVIEAKVVEGIDGKMNNMNRPNVALDIASNS